MKQLRVAILGADIALADALTKSLAQRSADYDVMILEPNSNTVGRVYPNDELHTSSRIHEEALTEIAALTEVYPDYPLSLWPPTMELRELTPCCLKDFTESYFIVRRTTAYETPPRLRTKNKSFANDAPRVPAWYGATQRAVHS